MHLVVAVGALVGALVGLLVSGDLILVCVAPDSCRDANARAAAHSRFRDQQPE